MSAALTGTPVAVVWAAGATPASQSVTIPSDATAVYMFWSFWRNASNQGLGSATLAGASPGQTSEIGTTSTLTATGVAAWYNPPTGSQTLNVTWDGAPTEGSTCCVVFTKDGDTSAWRDVDTAHNTSGTAVSVTLTTVSGDLVIKFDQKFAGSVPPDTAGWTGSTSGTNNSEAFKVNWIIATTTTQACPCEVEDSSSICAIAIPPAPAAPSTGNILGSSLLVGATFGRVRQRVRVKDFPSRPLARKAA